MAELEDIKGLFTETQKTAVAAQTKAAEMEKRLADVIDRDTLDRMQKDLAEKMTAMDEKQAALADRLAAAEAKSSRPGAPGAGQGGQETKLFEGWMRKGIEPPEWKSMQTNIGEDGGFLIPVQMRDGIQARLRRTSPVRAVASVVQTSASSYDTLVERGDTGFEWAGETQSRAETDSPTINRISITAHELSAMPKASQRLLDDATFDIGGWLEGRISDRFARAEATAFVAGNGVNQPKGFLTYATSANADDARAAETLQFRNTGGAGAFAASNPADVLVHTFYDLQGAYQNNAVWMAKNTTMALIATLKDGDGAYLLREILNDDGTLVRTVMGRPAVIADDMPTIDTGTFSIAVGDFGAGYTIVDGIGIRVLRDPYSAKPHVLFYATKRVGGGVTDFDAIKLIRFASS